MKLESKTRTRFKTSPEYKELKQESDLFKRRMFFLAFYTQKLKENGVDAILVGGEAIDLYTAGSFASADIDLVVNNKVITEKLLNRFGFAKQENTLWFNDDLNIVVQVIPESYTGDTEKLRKFKLKEYEIRVAAPEDLIAKRLYSMKFWKSNPKLEFEQSVALLALFSDSIDNQYLNRLARKDDTEDVLAEARKYAAEA